MTRQRALSAARWLFVLLTLALAWWGFRGRWGEIAHAASGVGPLRSVGAVLCAAAGLALTGLLWRLLLRWVGSDVGARDAAAVFFVGQLGKYVPGSLWSVAAQAQLGRRHDVPARSSVTASALFLLVHTASGLLVGGLLSALGAVDLPRGVAVAWAWGAMAAGAALLAPPVVRWLADRLAGNDVRAVFGGAELLRTVGLMALVWVLYGASLLLVVPVAGGTPGLVGVTAAFALAHAIGVLVVVAPAGVGAREAVLVALLSPALGVPEAAAVALLSRVAHALADFLVAGLAAYAARTRGPRGAVPVRVAEASASTTTPMGGTS
ncbi:lysylphosphatidylglycerol synthase domain-containing protein [Nocardioides hwasunensis]|uniref:UPF0104 family protein n=1 Tax=Nocardioides hwasunensis TaxID=397258 RepID=A0ABR8MB88_9ACTN|nr:YbhN family protein [Nocardioides hwasunensis]MBD3913128.1 UPF0104 family protein [Nocardioides hwasunensis]